MTKSCGVPDASGALAADRDEHLRSFCAPRRAVAHVRFHDPRPERLRGASAGDGGTTGMFSLWKNSGGTVNPNIAGMPVMLGMLD